ncbi:single-stranded DNA-binding protein 2-like [Penaeus indicus]|uniref:single-stranded DNA-binding protein 2-like n=1 Tax=Penaeus indicus TaxID=29960 RepID=UPI00300C2464
MGESWPRTELSGGVTVNKSWRVRTAFASWVIFMTQLTQSADERERGRSPAGQVEEGGETERRVVWNCVVERVRSAAEPVLGWWSVRGSGARGGGGGGGSGSGGGCSGSGNGGGGFGGGSGGGERRAGERAGRVRGAARGRPGMGMLGCAFQVRMW